MAKIVAKDQSLAGPAMIAFMLVELREYSGRLASQLIPFISAKEAAHRSDAARSGADARAHLEHLELAGCAGRTLYDRSEA